MSGEDFVRNPRPQNLSTTRWYWRSALAASIAAALSCGAAACGGSDESQKSSGRPQEELVPIESAGKYDMAGFPSGFYANTKMPAANDLQAAPGQLLTLTLRPDKTFVRELVGNPGCPPGAFCVMPSDPSQVGPQLEFGTYKFLKTTGGATFLRLYIHGVEAALYQYRMEGDLLRLLDWDVNEDIWIEMRRNAEESPCFRDDDCMPGENCKSPRGGACPPGAYCVMPYMEGRCEADKCGAQCEPWEVCTVQGSCPPGAYCILPMSEEVCVPKTCETDADCGSDQAFCSRFHSCPEGAICILPVVSEGVCKPKPPTNCPPGAYCVLPPQPDSSMSRLDSSEEEADEWLADVEQWVTRV